VYALEGGKLEGEKMPQTGFQHVGTSGEVKTGQAVSFPWSALKFGGQEFHIDCLNALRSHLMYMYYTGQLNKVRAEEILRWGYLFDMPMTDTGRPFNVLIPHPNKEKTFQAFTSYNSYACVSVRSMIIMHKGHGGACGNTVWHGAIFPERKDSLAFFDEDKLGYLRLLPDAHPEFKDYKIEYEKPWMKDVSRWMDAASVKERAMGTRYSESVFKNWTEEENIELVRWLLGPNEDNTRVTSNFLEEEGEISDGDDDESSDGDKMDLEARSVGVEGESGGVDPIAEDTNVSGRWKRASKEIAIEKTTRNTRQRLMKGPSKAKTRPKMRVEMEEVGREILLSLAGGGSGPGAAAQLKEPPPGGSTSQVTVGNNNRSPLPPSDMEGPPEEWSTTLTRLGGVDV
jgi:hypothetical protein